MAPSHLRGRVHLIGTSLRQGGTNGTNPDEETLDFEERGKEDPEGEEVASVMQARAYGLTIRHERVGGSLRVTVVDVEAGSPSDG